MIEGLDSATMPNLAQAQAAKAAGRRLWSGYLATRANVGLYAPWTKAGFDNARVCGGTPIAYCSGWDDPVALKALAAAWDVRLCLDVEGGIRGDGPWVPGFLDASGAGLYGGWSVHAGRLAAFHICAAYPVLGDPGGESWPSWVSRPAGPCGWQWCGTHSEFGVGVDSSWLDDWFGAKFSSGSGSITRSRRRVVTMATVQSLHQWVRGTDGALYHRRRSGGTWSPWKGLGGVLASEVIVAGADEKGNLVATGFGTDSKFYDYTSTDDGVTWSGPVNNGGGGDGLIALSPLPAASVGTVAAEPLELEAATLDLGPLTQLVTDAKTAAQKADVAAQSAADSAARIEAAVNEIKGRVDQALAPPK